MSAIRGIPGNADAARYSCKPESKGKSDRLWDERLAVAT